MARTELHIGAREGSWDGFEAFTKLESPTGPVALNRLVPTHYLESVWAGLDPSVQSTSLQRNIAPTFRAEVLTSEIDSFTFPSLLAASQSGDRFPLGWDEISQGLAPSVTVALASKLGLWAHALDVANEARGDGLDARMTLTLVSATVGLGMPEVESLVGDLEQVVREGDTLTRISPRERAVLGCQFGVWHSQRLRWSHAEEWFLQANRASEEYRSSPCTSQFEGELLRSRVIRASAYRYVDPLDAVKLKQMQSQILETANGIFNLASDSRERLIAREHKLASTETAARIAEVLGTHDQAIELLTECTMLDGMDPKVWVQLSDALSKAGEAEAAVESLRTACSQGGPFSRVAFFRLACALGLGGREYDVEQEAALLCSLSHWPESSATWERQSRLAGRRVSESG